MLQSETAGIFYRRESLPYKDWMKEGVMSKGLIFQVMQFLHLS